MTDPGTHRFEEIFAFPIRGPHDRRAAAPSVVYADDQDPRILTEAGMVSLFHSRILERAFVGEEMARRAWAVRRHLTEEEGGDVADASEAHAAHRGAAELLAMLAPVMAVPFRGAQRLERVAARLLLARANNRLSLDATDRQARAIAVDAARALRRAAP